MNKIFRIVSMLVVLMMVLGIFASPMSGYQQVRAQKEVPTFVVAPTEIPIPTEETEEPVVPPPLPEGDDFPVPVTDDNETPVEPGVEITPDVTELPEVVPLIEAAAEVAVPGRFIVVFKEGVDLDSVRTSVVEKIANGGGQVNFEYDSAINGITGEFSPEVLRKLRQDDRIEYIEMDQQVSAHDEDAPFTAQSLDYSPPSWGLDRIDQVNLPLDTNYYYPSSAGVGVHVYIIDSGIRWDHEQFDGRISANFDAVRGSGWFAADCSGHGTYVAGIVGGELTGVARRVNLHSVRVMDCFGSSYTSHLIAGINWVTKHHIKPAIANMSLGVAKSPSIDTAVKNAITKGITFVASAGNNNENACHYSPGRVSGVITVGATGNTDARASFSNVGNCVDIFAPGINITSTTMASTSSTGSTSGTSLAAAFVSGVAALYLSDNPTAKPSQVNTYILNNASPGLVTDPQGSPNRMLYIPQNVPTGPGLIYPANKKVIAEDRPEFSWRKVTNTDAYILEVSAEEDFSSSRLTNYISENYHEFASAFLDNVYYWRVRSVTSKGIYSPWSPVWKFTIDTTGPAAPAHSYPDAGVTVSGMPTFKWSTSPTAKAYQMAYDINNTPDDAFTEIFPAVTKPEYKPVAVPWEDTFYWYIRAKDSLGNWGPWSASRAVAVIPLKPGKPNITSPKNNFITGGVVDIHYSKTSYADQYIVSFASDPKFENIITAVIVGSSLNLIINMPYEGKYYYHVKARNSLYVDGDWSETRSFTKDITPPGSPTLKTPVVNATLHGNLSFTWTSPTSAKLFEIHICRDSNCLTPTYKKETTIPKNQIVGLGEGVWYWRVRAADSVRNWSQFSQPRQFTVVPPKPGKPVLRYPHNGNYTGSSGQVMSWWEAGYAHHYQVQVDNNNTFTSTEMDFLTSPGDTVVNIDTSVLPIGKYYWRVRSINSNDIIGAWSLTRYFFVSFEYLTMFDTTSALDSFTIHPGAAWHVNSTSHYAYNDGNVNSINSSSISFNETLTNFRVVARLKMDPGTGGSTAGNYGLVLRGTPSFNASNEWKNGYLFEISQKNVDTMGCFTIMSVKKGVKTFIHGFCDPLIEVNDWNKLAVSLKGKHLVFYVNDKLVWEGDNTLFTSGRVAVYNSSTMGPGGVGVPGRMYVDTFEIDEPMN